MRHDPEPTADERTMLTQFLDYHRATLLRKVDGLDAVQMATTTAASSLTLAGLLKHLTLVEEAWFVVDFAGGQHSAIFADVDWDADPDWEFRTAVDDDPVALVAMYAAACEHSRQIVADAPSLDTLSAGTGRNGQQWSLRWILLHLIEETARHNGHADLLREAIDGVTGE